MSNKPIKRHPALQALSREHHYGLLFCWKIREGFKRNIALERIKKYSDWFWDNYLMNHFAEEEKHLFVILADENDKVKKAITQHRKLKRLFENNKEAYISLNLIEEELEKHIRFEERILFNEIQQTVKEEQLKLFEKIHLHIPEPKFPSFFHAGFLYSRMLKLNY